MNIFYSTIKTFPECIKKNNQDKESDHFDAHQIISDDWNQVS